MITKGLILMSLEFRQKKRKIFKYEMAENLANLSRDTNLQIQEAE